MNDETKQESVEQMEPLAEGQSTNTKLFFFMQIATVEDFNLSVEWEVPSTEEQREELVGLIVSALVGTFSKNLLAYAQQAVAVYGVTEDDSETAARVLARVNEFTFMDGATTPLEDKTQLVVPASKTFG